MLKKNKNKRKKDLIPIFLKRFFFFFLNDKVEIWILINFGEKNSDLI